MEYTEEFNRFWKQYPSRWNSNLNCYVKRKKHPAFLKWQKLTKEIRDKCLRIVKQIKRAEGTPRDAVTWLNQQGWDDIDEPDEGKHLPSKMTNVIKAVPEHKINTNTERNRQRRELGV